MDHSFMYTAFDIVCRLPNDLYKCVEHEHNETNDGVTDWRIEL